MTNSKSSDNGTSVLLNIRQFLLNNIDFEIDIEVDEEFVDSKQRIDNLLEKISTDDNKTIDLDLDDYINMEFVEFEESILDESITEPYLAAYQKYAADFADSNIKLEPILSTKAARDTIYPIEYESVWQNYKTQLKDNWTVEEVDLSKDIHDWNHKLTPNERRALAHPLAFFATADSIVNANIKDNLIDVVTIKEAECAYGKQFEMENMHGEMYSIMLDTFIKNDVTKKRLIESIKTMPSIRRKAEFFKECIDSDLPYAHKLLMGLINEAIFFSGAFAFIFWLKTKPGNLMPGLIKSNMFIARDEALHVALGVILYLLLVNRLKESVVYSMIAEAVELEHEFIESALPCKLLGMNSELMFQYIQYVADRLLVQLGYKKLYGTTNPLEYMNKIDTFVKGNFFEERNDSYTDSKIDNPRDFVFLEAF
jgi:ribonucleotide reductase beta subunit family protein with ferritin-like domain